MTSPEIAARPRTAPTMTFVFPMPPLMTNQVRHWRVTARRKKAFNAQCDVMQQLGQLPPPPAQPWGKAVASAVMHLGSAMDNDNAGARLKFVWDWLKTRGYIADDRRKNLVLPSYPEQRIKRDKNYRVEITLTALEVVP